MTDKELLELAAKAAGYVITNWDYKDLYHGWTPVRRIDNENGWETTGWNPLTDDGDALRLAVTCSIDVWFDDDCHEVGTTFMVGEVGYNTQESWGIGGKLEATRRAITRAAAEIGKTMKS
jgi:hypothetical protein